MTWCSCLGTAITPLEGKAEGQSFERSFESKYKTRLEVSGIDIDTSLYYFSINNTVHVFTLITSVFFIVLTDPLGVVV